MSENSPTARLATFVSKLSYSDIPEGVIDHMKLCLLDTIGSGLSAFDALPGEDEGRQALRKEDRLRKGRSEPSGDA
jgi:2-methylcitrate dehydratase PrpD